MKKIILAALLSVFVVSVHAGDDALGASVRSAFGKFPGMDTIKKMVPGGSKEEKQQPSNVAAENIDCPSTDNTKLNFGQRAKAMATKAALDQAARVLALGEVELPAKIDNVCEADKRLAYIERSTYRWGGAVVGAVKQAAQALEIDQDIESYRAFENDDSLAKLERSDIVSLRKNLKKDMKKIETAMQKKTVEDAEMKKLLTKASANLRAATLHGAQIAAWDKRMVEFMGDNIPWTFNQLKRVGVFTDQMKLLGGTMKGVQKVSSAYQASYSDGVDQTLYEKTLAAREKENQRFEKSASKEFQL